MGLNTNHVLGRDLKCYFMAESAFNTFTKPTTAGSARVLKFDISHKVDRKNHTSGFQASRDVVERITGKEENSFSIEALLIPSGTGQTPCDLDQLITAAMGTQTINASDVTYTLNSNQNMGSLTGTRFDNAEGFMESLAGMLVDEMTISANGTDEPRIKFSGRAAQYAATGRSTLASGMSGSTTMVLSAADGWQVRQNSVIKIDDTADVVVTVDTSRPSFTVGTSVTESIGAAVVPYAPTYTVTGSPIAGVLGSCVLGSTTLVITSFELTLKNNLKYLDDTCFAARLPDAIPPMREISGKIGLRLRRDFVLDILKRGGFATTTLDVIFGSAAGNRFLVDCNQVELEFSDFQIPESEEATIEVPFKCLGTSAGNNALTFKHY